MALINLLGGNTSGKSLPATAQERVNLYYEVLPQQDKSQVVAYGWPGSSVWKAEGEMPGLTDDSIIGAYYSVYLDRLFVAKSDRLVVFDGSGTLIGGYLYSATLFSTDTAMSFAENIASPTATNGYELLFCKNGKVMRWDGTGINTPSTPALSAGASIEAVCFISGRFVCATSSGRFFWSNLNDGNTFGALSYATAESNSDKLLFVQSYKDNLILFGVNSIEIWGPSPDLNLPYARVITLQGIGLIAKGTVSQASEGIYFLGQGKEGGPAVYRMVDYNIEKISTPDIEDENERYGVHRNSRGYHLRFSGHTFYVLIIDFSGTGLYAHPRSYAFDMASGVWTKLSTNGGRYKYSGCVPLTSQASTITTYDTRVVLWASDEDQLYIVSYTDYKDVSVFSEKSLTCPHIFDGTSLNRLRLSRVRLDMENPGVSGNFRCGLSISRDGGKTYGTEMLRNISTTADGTARFEWRRLGIARDFVFKFRFPDSGKIAIIGAYVETTLANK